MYEEALANASHQRPVNIEDMIAAENDQSKRALLIVLLSINNSLTANTNTTRDISKKMATHLENFETHVEAEAELVNKGKGAWKVLATVLVVIQAIVGTVSIRAWDEMSNMRGSINTLQLSDIKLDDRISRVEERK